VSAPISVAIVSWNTRDLLRRALESLAGPQAAGGADVWVIDNASSDGSAEMVATEFPWVQLIASEENLGFGRAVNEVARRTSSPWLAPANADISVEPGALEELVAAGTAEPTAAILAPRLIATDGSTQQSVHAFPTVGLALALALWLPKLSRGIGDRLCIEGAWDPARPRAVDWAHGAFLLWRREAYDEIAGFDERQWMYAEDIDIAWRSRQAGWTVRYVPTARILHAGAAATAQAFGEQVGTKYMTATFAWMADRRGLAVTWAYAGVNLANALVQWLAFSLLSVLAPGRFARRRDAAKAWVALHRKGLRRRSALLGER
jgi:GT2 family glycosyltransferase